MLTSPGQVRRPELLIIDSKKLRQAGMMHLLEVWADATGLTVKTIAPDTALDVNRAHDCEMSIISVGAESIDDAHQQALIENARMLMPQALLVIVSDREDPEEIFAAFESGAVGFMPTSLEPALAFHALSFIRSGGSYFPPSVLFSCRHKATLNAIGHATDLTTKQEDVANLLCQGYPNKKIARQLGLSESTVKVHVRRIMHRFGVSNRTQLVFAIMNQIGNQQLVPPSV